MLFSLLLCGKKKFIVISRPSFRARHVDEWWVAVYQSIRRMCARAKDLAHLLSRNQSIGAGHYSIYKTGLLVSVSWVHYWRRTLVKLNTSLCSRARSSQGRCPKVTTEKESQKSVFGQEVTPTVGTDTER